MEVDLEFRWKKVSESEFSTDTVAIKTLTRSETDNYPQEISELCFSDVIKCNTNVSKATEFDSFDDDFVDCVENVDQNLSSFENVDQSFSLYENVDQSLSSYENVDQSLSSYETVDQSFPSADKNVCLVSNTSECHTNSCSDTINISPLSITKNKNVGKRSEDEFYECRESFDNEISNILMESSSGFVGSSEHISPREKQPTQVPKELSNKNIDNVLKLDSKDSTSKRRSPKDDRFQDDCQKSGRPRSIIF